MAGSGCIPAQAQVRAVGDGAHFRRYPAKPVHDGYMQLVKMPVGAAVLPEVRLHGQGIALVAQHGKSGIRQHQR
ncbi:hypothetical protein D3C87_2167500 [compost metagenome]